MSSKLYCSNCGKLIGGHSKFCHYCGAAQHGHESAAFRAQQPLVPVADSGEAKEYIPAGATVPLPPGIDRRHLAPMAVLSFALNYTVRTAILLPFLAVGLYFDPVVFGIFTIGYVVILHLVALAVYQSFYFTIDEDGLTKEYGIIHKRQVSIPYQQVQNVNITRNLSDRFLGLSRISIETAGSSSPHQRSIAGGAQTFAEGYLPGVSLKEARVIHDLLLQKAHKAV